MIEIHYSVDHGPLADLDAPSIWLPAVPKVGDLVTIETSGLNYHTCIVDRVEWFSAVKATKKSRVQLSLRLL